MYTQKAKSRCYRGLHRLWRSYRHARTMRWSWFLLPRCLHLPPRRHRSIKTIRIGQYRERCHSGCTLVESRWRRATRATLQISSALREETSRLVSSTRTKSRRRVPGCGRNWCKCLLVDLIPRDRLSYSRRVSDWDSSRSCTTGQSRFYCCRHCYNGIFPIHALTTVRMLYLAGSRPSPGDAEEL